MPGQMKLVTSSSHDDEDSITEEDKKHYEEVKLKLLQQISKLEVFIDNIESSLNFKYGDVEIKGKSQFINAPHHSSRSLSQIAMIDPDIGIEYELYRMAGLYCTKSANNEFVFNITTSINQQEKEAPATVQLYTDNKKTSLGKWTMPLGIHIQKVLSDSTPLEKPVHVLPFLKNCKRHVLCYIQRKQQCDEFKEFNKTIKNCRINPNYGYLTIMLDLLAGKIKTTGEEINITIYLFYHPDKVRPHVVKAELCPDFANKPKKNIDVDELMSSYLKSFEKKTLVDAYNKLVVQKHPVYEWIPEIYVESDISRGREQKSLEVNTSDERESSANYKPGKRKRTAKISRKSQNKRAKINSPSVKTQEGSVPSNKQPEPTDKKSQNNKSSAKPKIKQNQTKKSKRTKSSSARQTTLKSMVQTRGKSSKKSPEKPDAPVVSPEIRSKQLEDLQFKRPESMNSPSTAAQVIVAKKLNVVPKTKLLTSTPVTGRASKRNQMMLVLSPISFGNNESVEKDIGKQII